PHAAVPLIASAVDEERGGPAGGDLIASGEREDARLERHCWTDGRPVERPSRSTMTALFDPVEIALRSINLILPDPGGRPCPARGQLLGRRERRAIAVAFAGRRADGRYRIRIATFREAGDGRPAEMRARVRNCPLVQGLIIILCEVLPRDV